MHLNNKTPYIDLEKKLLKPDWDAPIAIHAYTTLKDYDEQNLQALLPNQPVWLKQVHSATAVEALPCHHQPADAVYTADQQRICAILTADCLPILVCNRTGTKIAALHAGWRGLAAGIIENTFAALSSPSDEWLVWLGPAIGPNHFEVGLDVFQAFTEKHSEAEQAFQALGNQKWMANLYLLAKQRLSLLGVTAIYGGHYCTYSQPDYFYSFRRDKGQTGRMISLIWIDDKKHDKL